MADNHDEILVNRLFIAVPELLFQQELIELLRQQDLIDLEFVQQVEDLRSDYRHLKDRAEKMRGVPLIQRVLSVAPELVSVRMVDLLRRSRLIGDTEAHALRLAVRTLRTGALRGVPVSRADLIRRLSLVESVAFSNEAIDFLREIGALTVSESNTAKTLLTVRNLGDETIASLARAKTLADRLMILGSLAIDSRTITLMKRAGVLNSRTAEAMLLSVSYAKSQWKVFEGAKRAEGLAARMAYVLSGSLNWEVVRFIDSLNILTPVQRELLRVAVSVSQAQNRVLMEAATNRRFRVQPGELPVKTFARATKETDRALLSLLAESAQDASKKADKLASLGRNARAAQLRVATAGLHRSMRALWEGVGHLTIFGEAAAAEAAVLSMSSLQRDLWRSGHDSVRRSIERQALAGIDSYISRKENTLALSRRVIANYDRSIAAVDKRINMGLLQGSSAKEIAGSIEKFINPRVPGGASYAAMRIGRTELSNAFHLSSIRFTREQPWVQGYKWNLSGSHKRPDVCDELATADTGRGAGVYRKSNVPSKPHPHCLCTLTIETVSTEAFLRGMRTGQYDRYLSQYPDSSIAA